MSWLQHHDGVPSSKGTSPWPVHGEEMTGHRPEAFCSLEHRSGLLRITFDRRGSGNE